MVSTVRFGTKMSGLISTGRPGGLQEEECYSRGDWEVIQPAGSSLSQLAGLGEEEVEDTLEDGDQGGGGDTVNNCQVSSPALCSLLQ